MSLDITIDTGPSGLNITSGILYLRLKITDNANYQSITSMNLNVDNVHPTDNPSGYTGAASDINGTAARVQGTAQDAGTVSGDPGDRGLLLVRGTLVYNPKTGATTTVGSYDFGDGTVRWTIPQAPAARPTRSRSTTSMSSATTRAATATATASTSR